MGNIGRPPCHRRCRTSSRGSREDRVSRALALCDRQEAVYEKVVGLVKLEATNAFLMWQSTTERVKDAKIRYERGLKILEESRAAAAARLEPDLLVKNEALAGKAQAEYLEAVEKQLEALINLERVTGRRRAARFPGPVTVAELKTARDPGGGLCMRVALSVRVFSSLLLLMGATAATRADDKPAVDLKMGMLQGMFRDVQPAMCPSAVKAVPRTRLQTDRFHRRRRPLPGCDEPRRKTQRQKAATRSLSWPRIRVGPAKMPRLDPDRRDHSAGGKPNR